jgi:hypothetical protein
MTDHPIHPACALWPRPSDEDVQALAASIKTEGLHNPIWLFEEAIIDGKTRYEACGIAGVAPRFQEYSGKDPELFTIAQNAKRRHLPKHELSFIAEELAQLKRGTNRYQNRVNVFANTSTQSQHKTMIEVGNKLGVSRQNIESVRQLKKCGEPNVVEMAKTGKVGVQNAARFAAHTPREEQRTATVDTVRKFREAHDGKSVRRLNKEGVPVWGKHNRPVIIPSKKTIAERKKPQPMLTIPLRDVTERLGPLIKRLKQQSKCSMATVSFATLGVLAGELEHLVEEWTSGGTGTERAPNSANSIALNERKAL